MGQLARQRQYQRQGKRIAHAHQARQAGRRHIPADSRAYAHAAIDAAKEGLALRPRVERQLGARVRTGMQRQG